MFVVAYFTLQSASVDLSSYAGASVQLRFTGVTGAGWSSDIAVDNVSLTTGGTCTCTRTFMCMCMCRCELRLTLDVLCNERASNW